MNASRNGLAAIVLTVLAGSFASGRAVAADQSEWKNLIEGFDWMLLDNDLRLTLIDLSDEPQPRSIVVEDSIQKRVNGKMIMSSVYWRGTYKIVVKPKHIEIQCRISERITSEGDRKFVRDGRFRACDLTFTAPINDQMDPRKTKSLEFSFASDKLDELGRWKSGKENALELYALVKPKSNP